MSNNHCLRLRTAIVESQAPDADVRTVLENGIREIAGEVRNSLDFHRSQEGGGEVARVVLSGAALDLPGFAEALQEQLGIEVERESVHLDGQDLGGDLRAPPGDRRRPGGRGGAAMRAFNLIPADERGGAGISAGKSGGGAFVVLGLLGVLAIFALLYGEASRQISSETRQDRDVERAGAGRAGAGRQARSLCQLQDDARTARAGGRPARRLALRLGPRLPRTRARAAPRAGLVDLADGHDRREHWLDRGRRRHGRGREQQSRRRDRRNDTDRG